MVPLRLGSKPMMSSFWARLISARKEPGSWSLRLVTVSTAGAVRSSRRSREGRKRGDCAVRVTGPLLRWQKNGKGPPPPQRASARLSEEARAGSRLPLVLLEELLDHLRRIDLVAVGAGEFRRQQHAAAGPVVALARDEPGRQLHAIP